MEIPEHALQVFERMHGLLVTIHDLNGNIAPFIHPHRSYHRSPLCLAVKACGRADACGRFERDHLRSVLVSLPEGRIHVCHSGLVEWVVPVFGARGIDWVLFAGARFPGKGLQSAVRVPMVPYPKPPWDSHAVHMPETVDEEEAQQILEHLRQVAARLRAWALEAKPGNVARRPGVEPDQPYGTRQVRIQRFIEANYTRHVTLPMLAKELGLSEGRTSHLVRQCFGASFRDLLVQKRLRAAMELLLHSGLGVMEVAMTCGFEDVAHFHRLFRKRIGVTPARYRVRGQT